MQNIGGQDRAAHGVVLELLIMGGSEVKVGCRWMTMLMASFFIPKCDEAT